MCRRGFSSFGEGDIIMRHIAERASRQFSKYSLEQLLQLHDLSRAERLQHLDGVLHVGFSKMLTLLQNMPLGFGSMGPIRKAIQDYVQTLRDLRRCCPQDEERYLECVRTIYMRHTGMRGHIKQGLMEFEDQIAAVFRPFADLVPTRCADASELVPALQGIEDALDTLFTIRTTVRLLMTHCVVPDGQSMKSEVSWAMQEVLTSVPDKLRDSLLSHHQQKEHVGAICLSMNPSLILIDAYRHAEHLCQSEFGHASQLLVNDVPAQEYLQASANLPHPETQFPYVAIHLYKVFFEVLRNALVSSVRRAASAGGRPPPIHASLLTGTSLTTENERTVRISDNGQGIPGEDVRKVWSYFYGAEERNRDCIENASQLSGKGLGLAISRVMMRYFGGDIDLHSINRMGTDVYIHL